MEKKRNLWVIPTDKPSKKGDIVIWDGLKIWDGIGEPPHHNQNIYITNSEKIKDGEYGICLNLVREGFKSEHAVFKMDVDQRLSMEDLGGQKKAEVLKVILTTDQDLIKDGVQAIDDEFLEWFVKNQSCEVIKVELEIGSLRWTDSKSTYKIIIPKEKSYTEAQQERSYSEEEVYNIVEQAIKDNSSKQLHFFDGGYSNPIYTNLKKWFEQFKKK